MTHKENITAILECYFTGFKKEIIDSACNRILEQTETVTKFADRCRECGKMRKGHWIKYGKLYQCSKCKELSCCQGKFCNECGARMVDPQEDKSKTEFWWNVIGGQREDL